MDGLPDAGGRFRDRVTDISSEKLVLPSPGRPAASPGSAPDAPPTLLVLLGATLLKGVGSGTAGMALTLLLHLIQHVAYGYSLDVIAGSESFLQGVTAAPPLRRIAALLCCGLVAGFGWGWSAVPAVRSSASGRYLLPAYRIDAALVAWSILVGPVLGFAAFHYAGMAAAARARAPRDVRIIPWCVAVLFTIGVAATCFPQLVGNGKGPTQLGLDGDMPAGLAVILLLLKLAATAGSLRAGAEGGLPTRGLTIGALLAVVLGRVWDLAGFAVPNGAFAVVGATGFLAASMGMPITAIVLVFEFTHVGQDFLIPIMLATASSMGMREWLHRRGLRANRPRG